MLILLFAGTAYGQDEEFPLPYVPPEPVRLGPWITTGEVEVGYRFTGLDGSRDAYRSVVDLPRIYINGGRRGYLLGMDPAELVRVLSPALVDVALQE